MAPGEPAEQETRKSRWAGPQSVLYRYSIAVLIPFALLAVAYGIWLKFPHNPLVFALTAVIVVSWHAGMGPGLLSGVAATAAIRVIFLPNSPLIPSLAECLRLGVFFGLTALISFLSTARRNAEQALRQANADLDERVREKTAELESVNLMLQAAVDDRVRANQRKDEFLAFLGHELRNPLAVMQNGLKVLELNPPPERQAKVLKTMARQIDHLARMVDDLVDVERISRGKMELKKEPVSLREALELAGAAVQARMLEKSHTLLVRLPDPDLHIEADRVRLEQVIVNLLTNAARYTPQGGRIELCARRSGDHCLISCSDNGVGLAPDMLESIFEPFVQYKSEEHGGSPGLGLGLNLVKRLAELHGGDVKAESAGRGAGSKFTLRWPVVTDSRMMIGRSDGRSGTAS